MYETNYHKAVSVAEATAMLSGADDGKFLSGGQTLIPTMKQRLAAPSDLIDISKIDEMSGITIEGKRVTIGAATTHADVASHGGLQKACPALSHLAGMIGDPHVRNRGTLGGSIANNDPAADYPAAMVGLNATINTSKRSMDADAFFTGMFETALDEDEMVVSVSFDCPDAAAYEKFPNPASRYAMAGVFVAQSGGAARVAVTGAGADGVFRHGEMEASLAGNFASSALEGVSVDAGDMLADMHGSSAYRANLVKVLAKRAVDKAA